MLLSSGFANKSANKQRCSSCSSAYEMTPGCTAQLPQLVCCALAFVLCFAPHFTAQRKPANVSRLAAGFAYCVICSVAQKTCCGVQSLGEKNGCFTLPTSALVSPYASVVFGKVFGDAIRMKYFLERKKRETSSSCSEKKYDRQHAAFCVRHHPLS